MPASKQHEQQQQRNQPQERAFTQHGPGGHSFGHGFGFGFGHGLGHAFGHGFGQGFSSPGLGVGGYPIVFTTSALPYYTYSYYDPYYGYPYGYPYIL